jgi:hypothetical protein
MGPQQDAAVVVHHDSEVLVAALVIMWVIGVKISGEFSW